MPVYRPRMLARLLVPVDVGQEGSETLTFDMRVRSATLEYNGHNAADTLEIEAPWGDLGIDPRFARNAAVEFYLGDAGERDVFVTDRKTYRFAGLADKVERIANESGHVAKITCRDFTGAFLDMKPFPEDGRPFLTETLEEAWARVCDHVGFRQADGSVVSSVRVLRDRLALEGGVASGLVLGRAVSSRFRGKTRVEVATSADGWAVWQQAVGMLGLLSYIDRDRCVVTTSVDHFAEDTGGTPRLLWGSNVLSMTERAIGKRSSKGILLTSYDPATGTSIEAAFNPNTKTKKRVGAHKRAAPAPAADTKDYEAHDYYGITDPDELAAMAERVWLERASQELEGELETAEMRIGTDAERVGDAGAPRSFDLLDLRAGDSVRIEVDPLDEGVFTILSSDVARANYLIDRGYAPNAAHLLARNAGRLMQLGRTFKVRTSRTHLSTDGEGGEFKVHLTYCNRLELQQLRLAERELTRS